MAAFKVKPILLQKTESRQVDDLQRGLSEPIRQLQTLPPMQGSYLTGISFPQLAQTVVKHKLKRAYVGWVLCRPRDLTIFAAGAINLVEDPQAAEFNDTQITFANLSATTFTADLWVY